MPSLRDSAPSTPPAEPLAGPAALPPASPAQPASSGSTDYTWVFGFLFMGVIFYKISVWDNIPTLLWRLVTTGSVLLVALIALVVLWKRSKGKEAWRIFLDKLGLFSTLVLTILGAAGVAVALDDNSRALAFKLFVIGFFSVLPAWLYYQFLARRGSALWDEYVMNLFRLHADRFAALPMPPRQSVFYLPWLQARTAVGADVSEEADERNIYRKKFVGVFSVPTGQAAHDFFRGENSVPVVVSTVLISVGWVVVVQPESVLGWSALPPFDRTGVPAVPLAELRFAFLGAYFFILQMLVRRYYHNDLKTGAYINATLRIVIVVLLTWILGVVWPPAWGGLPLAGAFVIGVFPDVGWQALVRTSKRAFQPVRDLFNQRYPLSDLDGLNPWYEARLVEEGIEDLQTLVTANIVDLMLYTRIPVERLVDWIDQAVLYLHVVPDGEGDAKKARAKLRRFGIRAATDMLDAYDRDAGTFIVPEMKMLLNSDSHPEPNVMSAIVTALQREPVLHYVRRWKYFPEAYLAAESIPQSSVLPGRYTPQHGMELKLAPVEGSSAS